MSRLFEQARSMSLEPTALGGGLAGEFGLNLRCDFNSDRRAGAPP